MPALDPTFLAAGHAPKGDEFATLFSIFTSAVSASEPTLATSASTSYTETLSSGLVLGVGFTVPATGAVKVTVEAVMSNSTTGVCLTAFQLFTGSQVVGDGSSFHAASDAEAADVQGTSQAKSTMIIPVTGLTADDDANVRVVHRVNTGTGTFLRRYVLVEPWLGV